MIIGIPKEIKNNENRVALTPAGAKELVKRGHTVYVQHTAGENSGFPDSAYETVGAKILPLINDVYQTAEMIVKVKEPIAVEYPLVRKGQLVFTYFHFASDEKLTLAMMDSGSVCLAYETVENPDGTLPLLIPMSEVAGRMSIQEGARFLEKPQGGKGILLGGVPGVKPARVLVLGGGIVGYNAALMAAGMGADVTIADISLPRLIDQGGCFETSHPTTHADPVYTVDGIVHYCVANIPGAVPQTSTLALTNATLPYVLELADKGWKEACKEDKTLYPGLNIIEGQIVYPAVAEAFGLPCYPAVL